MVLLNNVTIFRNKMYIYIQKKKNHTTIDVFKNRVTRYKNLNKNTFYICFFSSEYECFFFHVKYNGLSKINSLSSNCLAISVVNRRNNGFFQKIMVFFVEKNDFTKSLSKHCKINSLIHNKKVYSRRRMYVDTIYGV